MQSITSFSCDGFHLQDYAALGHGAMQAEPSRGSEFVGGSTFFDSSKKLLLLETKRNQARNRANNLGHCLQNYIFALSGMVDSTKPRTKLSFQDAYRIAAIAEKSSFVDPGDT